MKFTVTQPVLFKHCDPAGIVFYPRYFEMINDAIEAFFTDALNMPWHLMHKTHGVPTASISCDFFAPSRHGDVLEIAIHVVKIGRTSLGLTVTARCDSETRFVAASTLVYIASSGQPEPWSDANKTLFSNYLNESSDDT